MRLYKLRVLGGRVKARLRDLSRSWMDPSLAQKQREIVDCKLQEMYAGDVPGHFSVLVDIFAQIAASSDPPPERLTVLDAGCASGYYYEVLNHLVPLRLSYCGCDFNQAMLELARQRYPNVPFARADLRSLAWPDRSFDVVLSGAVLVHVREWKEAVGELARVARRWLVLHRTAVSLKGASFVTVQKAYGAEVYSVHIQEAELMSLLRSLGYRLISKLDSREGPAGPDSGNYTYLFLRENGSPGG